MLGVEISSEMQEYSYSYSRRVEKEVTKIYEVEEGMARAEIENALFSLFLLTPWTSSKQRIHMHAK